MGYLRIFLVSTLIIEAIFLFNSKIPFNQGLTEAKAQETETITVSTDLKFLPTDDVSVSSKGSPNNGASLRIEKSKRATTQSYLKFPVSGVTSRILSAKLLLHANATAKQGGTTYQVTNNNWTESSMTWQNKPALGSALSSINTALNTNNFGNTPSATGDYYEWDVSAVVIGDGVYSFGFANTCNNCSASFNSSESSNFRPYLVLVVEKTVPTPVVSDTDPIIIGAGDIASCTSLGDEATANLLDGISGTVVAMGDTVYEDGTLAEYNQCYEPTWGRHKARTKPAIGNHEYHVANAADYFTYFGAAAGEADKGYYSYNLNNWHVVVLNSDCNDVPGGCGIGSPQETWLKADLAANPASCTLAYYHHGRFTSGTHSSDFNLDPFWRVLYDNGVDLALFGHDHNYERLSPLDKEGMVDYERGIRSIKVGTGGGSLSSGYNTLIAGSEVKSNLAFGVLKVGLHSNSYNWEFIPEAGKTFTDSGIGLCH